jgi:HEAT repeat protein
MLPPIRTALLLGALALAPRDLDVAVPPGSPLDWSRSFPAITPGGGALFPASGAAAENPGKPEDTISKAAGHAGLAVQSSSAFGLVRILTWDLAAHLEWVSNMPPPPDAPTTGRAGLHPPLPQPGEALYWMTVAPLLRLMLHPAAVSRAEVLGHLAEIGEPALAILPAAAGEDSLATAVEELEALIVPARDAAPAPRAKDAPTAAMRSRLVFEELSSRFAHDPVAGFGDRMFLLGEELLPEIVEYASDGNAFVRRNAVAALGRFRSPEAGQALLDVATTTEDPVALLRALNGLGRLVGAVDASGLGRRLERTEDPVLFAALCAAAGRAHLEPVVPHLLGRARTALAASPRDADVLIATLSAFAELRPRKARGEVLALLEEIRADTVAETRAYVPDVPKTGLAPDNADPLELRAEIVRQLALVVRVRMNPGDANAVSDLLALRDPVGPGPVNRAFFPVRTNDSLRDVHPPVRFLYLATLRDCGAGGTKALAEAAQDARSEAAIRGYALAQMPWTEAAELSEHLVRDAKEGAEMRIQAFEVAVALRHPKLRELGHVVLAETAKLPPGEGTAAERYLGLTAVRALGQRGNLSAQDLLPLLPHVKSERSAHADLPEQLAELAHALVRRAALGAPQATLEELVNDLLDVAIAGGANAELTETTRSRERREILVLVSGAHANRRNTEYLRLVGVAIVERMLGWSVERRDRTRGEFAPRVLLEEEILLALGRTGAPAAKELLLNVLANRRNRHRASACLALGMLGPEAAGGAERTLLTFLADGDPFVRFTAATSLTLLTEAEVDVDWMYGDPQARLAGAERYMRAIEEVR